MTGSTPSTNACAQIGMDLCTLIERVLDQAGQQLECIWQHIAADVVVLASASPTAHAATVERVYASVQHQDRHAQILQHTVAALARYRALLAMPADALECPVHIARAKTQLTDLTAVLGDLLQQSDHRTSARVDIF